MDQGCVNDRLMIPNHMRLTHIKIYIISKHALHLHAHCNRSACLKKQLAMGPGVKDDLSIMYNDLTSSSADSFDKK